MNRYETYLALAHYSRDNPRYLRAARRQRVHAALTKVKDALSTPADIAGIAAFLWMLTERLF